MYRRVFAAASMILCMGTTIFASERMTFAQYQKNGGFYANARCAFTLPTEEARKAALYKAMDISNVYLQYKNNGVHEDWTYKDEVKDGLKFLALESIPLLWFGGRYVYLKGKKYFEQKEAKKERDRKLWQTEEWQTLHAATKSINSGLRNQARKDMTAVIMGYTQLPTDFAAARTKINQKYRDQLHHIDWRNSFYSYGNAGDIDAVAMLIVHVIPFIVSVDFAWGCNKVRKNRDFQTQNARLHQEFNAIITSHS